MNDQSNPVGTDQADVAAKASGRRRLVRGTVSLAPLVLTLRSGALAAASCTAARVVTVDSHGKIPNGSSADVNCINATTVPICEGYPLTGDTKVTTMSYTLVPVERQGQGNSSNYFCGDPQNPTIVNKQVAILSSAGTTSILALRG